MNDESMMLSRIVKIMKSGREFRSYELCRIYKSKHKKLLSESTMTAKLRQLRWHPKFKLQVKSRPPSNPKVNGAWFYSIPKEVKHHG